MRKKLWRASEPYPNQAPGSAYCNEREERAERFERLEFERLHNQKKAEPKKDVEKIPATKLPAGFLFCWRCGNEGPKEDFTMTAKVNASERTRWACKTGIGCFSYDAI